MAMSNPERSYHGYLGPHVERIRSMYMAGADTRTIAEELYRLGVRAHTNHCYVPTTKMRRMHQITNLRGQTLHVLRRLGLHTPRKRARGQEP
jgi:hypothetical protein